MPVEKLTVHRRGLRHRAVSVFVNTGERTLLQRRSLGKYHSPGLWANGCCTHPLWEEDPADCARRRLNEELGIDGLTLEHHGQLEYRAAVGDGMIEHELVDIFTVEAPADLVPRPDPAEVMGLRWAPLAGLGAEIAARPGAFTAWLAIYVNDHHLPFMDPAAAQMPALQRAAR